MKLPEQLAAQIESAIGASIRAAAAVRGGCISDAARLVFTNGETAFLKWAVASEQPSALFSEEARSLRAIAATNAVRVPGVLANRAADDYAWLLLEWLEPGPRTARSQARLGEQLAAMHRHSAGSFGWPADNFIGSLPQSNREHPRWSDFWRTERLEPQLRMAAHKLDTVELSRLRKLCDECGALLGGVEVEGPSLVHGDLWSGNLHTMADGTAAIIDPSSYYGHREVDLAMARLFGGFAEEFYAAYAQAWPCLQGLEQRLLLYQLYYLLVHINLFGGGYTSQTMSVAAQLGF